MAADVSGAELMLRLVLSMGAILAIIVVAAKLLRSRGGFLIGRPTRAVRLDLLDRVPLGRHASVAVVRVGERGLVVGITEASVRLLAEAPELIEAYEQGEAERTAPPVERNAPRPARMNFFEALREATVRRS